VDRLRSLEIQPPRQITAQPSGSGFLSCSCRLDDSRWDYSSHGVSMRFWRTASRVQVHRRNCALYAPLKRVEVGATYYGKLLSGMISFSIAISHGAGSFSLVPNITYRATVPYNSPAFALLRRIANLVFKKRIEASEVPELIINTMKQLQQLYQDRKFNPTDVEEDGATLFHARISIDI